MPVDSVIGGFYWLFIWTFKEIKHQPFSMTQPFQKTSTISYDTAINERGLLSKWIRSKNILPKKDLPFYSSRRGTNAKGQPYKPPATPLTLTKIFEEDGVGFGEGKGKLSRESFPFPSPMLPITPQPSRPWRVPRRRRPLEGRRGRRRTRRRLWPRPRWSRP